MDAGATNWAIKYILRNDEIADNNQKAIRMEGINIVDFQIKNGVLVKYSGNGGEVIVPEGVASIADCAFEGGSSLTSIVIPKSVTSIGDFAFHCCSGLTINTPEGSAAQAYAMENDIPFQPLTE